MPDTDESVGISAKAKILLRIRQIEKSIMEDYSPSKYEKIAELARQQISYTNQTETKLKQPTKTPPSLFSKSKHPK